MDLRAQGDSGVFGGTTGWDLPYHSQVTKWHCVIYAVWLFLLRRGQHVTPGGMLAVPIYTPCINVVILE